MLLIILLLAKPLNKIFNRVGVYSGYQNAKSREFIFNGVKQQLLCKLLTLKVADVRNQQFSFGIKKFVVFKIGGNKYICTRADGLF